MSNIPIFPSSSSALRVKRSTPLDPSADRAVSMAARSSAAFNRSGSLIVWMMGQIGLPVRE